MPALRRLPVVADMTLVTAGAMTANVAGYLLQLLAGRWLGVSGYSEFASLLAVQLLAAVPALALQNVVARELVRGAQLATVRRLTRHCAGIVAVLAVVLVPIVSLILHLGSLAAAGALMAAPILVLLSGDQGILQGENHFRRLAIVLGGVGVLRVTPAVIALAAGGSAATALWAGALGLLVAAGAAHRITLSGPIGGTPAPLAAAKPPGPGPGTTGADGARDGTVTGAGVRRRRAVRAGASRRETTAGAGEATRTEAPADAIRSAVPADAPGAEFPGAAARSEVPDEVVRAGSPDSVPRAATVTAVLRAAQVQAALMALSSVDLIVARIVLDEDRASLYALGAIATKIAFWFPQAVGMVLYPQMAQPQHSARALRSALAVLGGIGLLAVLGAAVLSPLAPVLAGADYAPIQQWLWLFALEGALLALLQGALLSALAADRTALATVIWVGLAVELAVTLPFVRSLPVLITVATTTAAVVTTVLVLLVLRTARRVPAVGRSSG